MFLILSPFTVDPHELRAHVDLICEAAEIPSIEKLALALGMDEGQLKRQIRGDGHLSLSRIVATLGKQNPAFWRRYGWLLACHFGVPSEAKRSAWLVLGYFGKRQQLKMATRSRSQKRSA
jgi:hypothetical protein